MDANSKSVKATLLTVGSLLLGAASTLVAAENYPVAALCGVAGAACIAVRELVKC